MEVSVTSWELREMVKEIERNGRVSFEDHGGHEYVMGILAEALRRMADQIVKVNA